MKNHWWIRICTAFLFLCLCLFVMVSMYSLSEENGADTSNRSSVVTSVLKDEVNETLAHLPKGTSIKEKIKLLVIRYSPYGDDWEANVRKLAHFSIYFAMAAAIYIVLWIMKVKPGSAFIVTLCLCLLFALGDELHQGHVIGRTMSKKDVLIDSLGAFCSAGMMSLVRGVFHRR